MKKVKLIFRTLVAVSLLINVIACSNPSGDENTTNEIKTEQTQKVKKDSEKKDSNKKDSEKKESEKKDAENTEKKESGKENGENKDDKKDEKSTTDDVNTDTDWYEVSDNPFIGSWHADVEVNLKEAGSSDYKRVTQEIVMTFYPWKTFNRSYLYNEEPAYTVYKKNNEYKAVFEYDGNKYSFVISRVDSAVGNLYYRNTIVETYTRIAASSGKYETIQCTGSELAQVLKSLTETSRIEVIGPLDLEAVRAEFPEQTVRNMHEQSNIRIELDLSQVTGLTSIGFAKRVETGPQEYRTYCFPYSDIISSLILPEGIKTIEDDCFDGLDNLIFITLPDSLESIGKSAFSGLDKLKEITIPNGVKTIGDYAFVYCQSLIKVTIPESVEKIGNYVFDRCSKLSTVILQEGIRELGQCIFSRCTSLSSIYIPESVIVIGEQAFDDCSNLKAIEFADTKSIWYVTRSSFSGSYDYERGPMSANPSENVEFLIDNCSSIYNQNFHKKFNISLAEKNEGGCIELLSQNGDKVETAEPGDVIKFCVKTNEGYILNRVDVAEASGSYVSCEEDKNEKDKTFYHFIMPRNDVVVSSDFIKGYKVHLDDSIKNGSVILNNNPDEYYKSGTYFSYQIKADDGYEFKSLSVKTEKGDDVEVWNEGFSLPECNVIISAEVVRVYKVSAININSCCSIVWQAGNRGVCFLDEPFVLNDKVEAGEIVKVGIGTPPKNNYRLTGIKVTTGGNTVSFTKVEADDSYYGLRMASYVSLNSYYSFIMPAGDVTIEGVFEREITEVSGRTLATEKIGKYEAPYEIGDIVFKDGSATPFNYDLNLTEEEKESAIAVIFYTGNQCNNEKESGNRTLGIGLVQTNAPWCTEAAKGYDYYFSNAVCSSREVLTMDSTEYTGCLNGKEIFKEIVSNVKDAVGEDAENKYPAFYFAEKYAEQDRANVAGTDYSSGWYVPTIAELHKIWEVSDILDSAIYHCRGTYFTSSTWGSSNQQDKLSNNIKSCYFSFKRGRWDAYPKDRTHFICVIREF